MNLYPTGNNIESISILNSSLFESPLMESAYLGKENSAFHDKGNICSRIRQWVMGLFTSRDKKSDVINSHKVSCENSKKDLNLSSIVNPNIQKIEINREELKIFIKDVEEAIRDNNSQFLFEKMKFIHELDNQEQEYKILKEKTFNYFIDFFKSEMLLSDFESLDRLETVLFSYIKNLNNERKNEIIPVLGYLASYFETPEKFKTAIMTLPQKIAQAEGGTRAERQTHRTPSEVMVHLLSYLDAHKNEKKHLPPFSKICQISKHNFLEHKLSLDNTKNVLKQVQELCENIDELKDLDNLCKKLNNQLPNSSKCLFDTRLQDSIYTRAFDSALIEDLIKNPSEGIKSASEAAGRSFATWFQYLKGMSSRDNGAYGAEVCLEAVDNLKKVLIQSPRFWISQVPDLVKIQNSSTSEEVEAALLSFFNSPKSTGIDCVAMQFIIAKFSKSLEDAAVKKQIPKKEERKDLSNRKRDQLISPFAPWLARGNLNYRGEISKETSRIINDRKKLTKGSGITLAYQPLITQQEDWMFPNERPTTVNRPNLEKQSSSTQVALQNALPWASGISGTTNILLYYLNFCQSNQQVDSKDFLLGTMMFMVYDGGHSIHEVLWVANQLDKTLNLNLNLNPTRQKNSQFISDYGHFLKIFQGNESGQKLKNAYEVAFEKLYQYFNQHSYYADVV